MSTSPTKIANIALSALERTPINAITEAGNSARICAAYYDQALEETLEMHDWVDVRKYLTLSQMADFTELKNWSYAYLVPAEVLTVRNINGHYNPSSEYELTSNHVSDDDNQILLCNDSTVVARCTVKGVSEVRFSSNLAACIGLKLAYYVAGPIGSGKMRQGLEEAFARKLSAAMTHSANQEMDTIEDWTPEVHRIMNNV